MRRHGIWLVLGLAGSLCGCRACGARGGHAPGRPNIITEGDGVTRYQVDKGQARAYYDPWGRLERIELDSNRDGKVDRISHHAGRKEPGLVEVDTDFDGRFDRWEQYDDASHLVRVGAARRGTSPDVWEARDPQGHVLQREYDDDRDGRIERIEVLENERIVRTEFDSDRDGRMDRWQRWSQGHLMNEELDTNGDGRPDRSVIYGKDGKVMGLRRLPPR